MNRTQVIAKLKKYIERELDEAKRYAKNWDDVMQYRANAYGALNFVNNTLYPYDEELGDWWNNDMWNKFQELAIEKRG